MMQNRIMTRIALIFLAIFAAAPAVAQTIYYPGAGADWKQRAPDEVGLNAARLADAIAFAKASEAKGSRDLELTHRTAAFGREPFSEPVGPFRSRGEPTGIIVRHGYIVAEWGDPHRVDMTFSVTKSFVSTVVGLAFDRKLITLDERVADAIGPVVILDRRDDEKGRIAEPFTTPHSKSITWDHLLRQTSDWKGELWGKPDWADRPAADLEKELSRERHVPGSVYEYNDTRVNLLALAAMHVWRRPLPAVLNELVMQPIGASRTWRWLGYQNSWVLLDGTAMQSVSGGGHWGGGMFISARDQARFGLLTLRRGRWNQQRILSEEWIRLSLTPTPAQKTYGFMNFFVNTNREFLPSAPPEAFAHLGAGTNAIYVDPVNDLVVVVRWIERSALDGFISRVLAAVAKAP